MLKKTKNKDRILKTICLSVVLMTFGYTVFGADSGTAGFNNIMKFFSGWVAKVGMGMVFFGAVQTALAFKNDDADSKGRGLKTIVSGFMLVGVTQAPHLFGL